MNYKHNGGFDTKKGRMRRFVSSAIIEDRRVSSIAVISAILMLAIVSCTLFAFLGDGISLPAWELDFGNTDDELGPYATKTDKKLFVAKSGGKDMSNLDLYAEHAILIRISDMSTVAYKDADTVIYPASMTKVMTVVVALDHIQDLDATYEIKRSVVAAIPSGSSNAGLYEFVGKKMSYRDLLYGISYLSASDSVLCVIDALGLTMDEFVSLMNEKAKEIGLKNTTFGGAIGMDTERNQTTCRDVAAIMAYAMENPICRELFGGTQYRTQSVTDLYYNSTLHTSVKEFGKKPDTLLDGYTLLAAKSGYEVLAGYCLVSYIENDVTGERFVLVTANAEIGNDVGKKARIYDMIDIFKALKP